MKKVLVFDTETYSFYDLEKYKIADRYIVSQTTEKNRHRIEDNEGIIRYVPKEIKDILESQQISRISL